MTSKNPKTMSQGKKLIHQTNSNFFKDKKILVTGAAGSIGSELCAQIAKLNPKLLIISDISETELFYLDMKLREEFPKLKIETKILDIKDMPGIDLLFKKFKPDTVFHAAAFKHISLMEDHPREAILNNVLGTKNLLEKANRYQVKDFINISTDKAVEPKSVMGASKRIVEKFIMASNYKFRVVSVRFGNIIGSRGSILPILEKQINRGGPVTITDKRMTRYFMTANEAAYLLLEVAAIGHNQKIFMFDMGKPIKILDMATNLVNAHNKCKKAKIKISFVGKKKGEKISEKLCSDDEEMIPTERSKIFMITSKRNINKKFSKKVANLVKYCQMNDDQKIIKIIMSLAN